MMKCSDARLARGCAGLSGSQYIHCLKLVYYTTLSLNHISCLQLANVVFILFYFIFYFFLSRVEVDFIVGGLLIV